MEQVTLLLEMVQHEDGYVIGTFWTKSHISEFNHSCMLKALRDDEYRLNFTWDEDSQIIEERRFDDSVEAVRYGRKMYPLSSPFALRFIHGIVRDWQGESVILRNEITEAGIR